MSDSDIVWVASFDIGKKNFAFYIEEFDKAELMKLPRIPNSNRYNADGTTTPCFTNIVKKVCLNGKKILFENTDLTAGDFVRQMKQLLDLLTQISALSNPLSFAASEATKLLKRGVIAYSNQVA
jgi:hypothetical protein